MKKRLTLTLASAFYIGFIPGAPGTYASIATTLVFFAVYCLAHRISPALHIISLCLISLIGVFVSGETSRKSGIEDPSFVVIDEVAGQLLTFLFLPVNAWNLFLGLAAFRIFDMWKPFPIRKLESLPGGFGIMADDLLAGVYGALAVHLINVILLRLGMR
jgi:phosphatidylglycerophosphatase A